MSVQSKMTALADAVRAQTGHSGTLTLDEMTELVRGLAQDVTAPSGTLEITENGTYDVTPYAQARVAVPDPPAPDIQVSAGGLITATAGGKTKTHQLTTKSAATIVPGTATRTIGAQTYLTGTQTIKGDANLKPENIRSGVKIFGVTGTCEAAAGPDETAYAVRVKNLSQYSFTIVAGGRSVTLAGGASAPFSLPLHSPMVAYDADYNYPANTIRGGAEVTIFGCAAFLHQIPAGEAVIEVVD